MARRYWYGTREPAWERITVGGVDYPPGPGRVVYDQIEARATMDLDIGYLSGGPPPEPAHSPGCDPRGPGCAPECPVPAYIGSLYGTARVPVAGNPEGAKPVCERCGHGISEMPCDDCVTFCTGCGESHYPECMDR